jgi:hypothetical protein
MADQAGDEHRDLKAAEYRAKAEECLRMAEILNFGRFKQRALEMAQFWLRKAEEAEHQRDKAR